MCCLFGLIDYNNYFNGKQKSKMLSTLATQCEARGTDATGIAYNHNGNLSVFKKALPGHRMKFRIPNDSKVVMGHTRLTTQGSEKKNQNNHPFKGQIHGQNFALAHNGVLYNDKLLRHNLSLPQSHIETDSYIAVQIIEQQRTLTFDSVKYMAEQVDGTFVFTVLDEQDNLYFVKGDNPLCLYHYPKTGFYLYASTEEILTMAIKRIRLPKEKPIKISAKEGDILRIDPDGDITTASFSAMQTEYCMWGLEWQRYISSSMTSRVYHNFDHSDNIQEMKSVATAYGYSPDDIDEMLDAGFTLDDVEEILYCGEW